MSPRTVFSPYARIFAAVPGSPAFSMAGWLARLPMPILGLGAVLLVEGETGSYGLAGAVAGTLALVGSLASPQWARPMDRRGQGVVLRDGLQRLPGLRVAFVAAVVLGAPQWTWFVLAGLTGACGPNIGSIVRARWADALDADARQTAFAFESVVDEVVFVVGPPLVTFLATLINPPVGFLTGVVIGFTGAMWLSGLQDDRAAGAAGRADGPRRRSALLHAPVLVVGGGLPRRRRGLRRHGRRRRGLRGGGGRTRAGRAWRSPSTPGGSLVAGLAYGVVRLPGTLAARFVGCAVFFGIAAQVLLAVDSLVSLVAGRLPGRTGHRAGARLRHVAGGVAGAPRGAHRGADLGRHRAHARASPRGRRSRAPASTPGVPRPPSPSPRCPRRWPACWRWPGPGCCAAPPAVEHRARSLPAG